MTELYVKGVVIACGIPDTDGDILDKKQIKQLFTKFTMETDTMHTYIKNEGVDVIENWITETPTQISGKDVPSGSWLCTTKITNPELIKSIQENKLNAYSLGSVPVEATTEKYWFINKSVKYKDIVDIENIKPLFISFVDRGANGYTFEIMTYDVYINKNDKRSGDVMEEKQTNEEMVSLSGLEKIAKIFGINKADKTKETEKQTEPPKKDDEDDISNKELLENIKTEVADGVVAGLTEFAKQNKKSDEEKPDKQEKSKTDEKQKSDEEKQKAEETPKEKTDKQKINKRATKKTENIDVPEVNTNFYKKSGRDVFGCKIRK